jgi:hypothetical protein
MGEVRHHWFDLKLLSSVADVILKIAAALGIILGVSLHVFRANVVLEAPPPLPAEAGRPLSDRSNPFFQAELDSLVVRDEYAKLGRTVPLAVEVLVDEYNRDNELDLKDMGDRTQPTTPIRDLCGPWRATSEGVFGAGFCADGGPKLSRDRRLRYWGRTYERRLIEANDAGRSEVPPMRLPVDQLSQTLDILHRAEFGAARVELTNTGRAVATDVRLHAPPGYAFVGTDGEEFSLQPGRTAVRRLETKRGERPQTIDRSVGVQWGTGKGFVPGGRNTVLAVCGIVAAAILYALGRDWMAYRRSAPPPEGPPPEPPVA